MGGRTEHCQTANAAQAVSALVLSLPAVAGDFVTTIARARKFWENVPRDIGKHERISAALFLLRFLLLRMSSYK